MNLAEKSAEVRQLEWIKGMLEISLKNGNKVMILIQSSAATTSKETLHKEIKVLIDVLLQSYSEGKLLVQCIVFCSRINCHLWRRS